MPGFIKRPWLALGLWLLVILPVGGFVLASGVLLVQLYWPRDYEAIDFSRFRPQQAHMVILAHGLQPTADTWIIPLNETLTSRQIDTHVVGADWKAYSQNPLRCAIEGKRIGRLIGEQMLTNSTLQTAHFMAHSCGSFVIYGACQAIKSARPAIQIQTTYLDPVSIYGPFWNYGIKHFGDCADYSEAYIDTSDDVPGSNQPLPHAYTYDVTPARMESDSEVLPHNWPVVYYRQLVGDGQAPQLRHEPSLPEQNPAGVVDVVTE